ncbi:hypothetical protein GGR50DRAFT_670576 [Xylaria sp. CBS 124048]|nr:hypothetical protein GGR50DRAFT_670576 [Xylaria sp. CBS 124048]
MERMRENPKVREWWAMTDGFQEVSRSLSVSCFFLSFFLPTNLPTYLPTYLTL